MENLNINDDHHSFVMVAAIDFGTTYSGYAFSFTSEPNNVKMNKNWGAALGLQSYKTPTCVLTNPQGEFVTFGYSAEQQYGQVVETKEYGGIWSLYRHFKMLLHHSKDVSRQSKIKANSGVERAALDIFVMALRYLKQHLLDTVALQTSSTPDSSMIRWVITVPAIWSDESKRFMREAAFKAGFMKHIDSDQLLIALEPEAASLHCRCLDVAEFVGEPDKDSIQFKAGTKYIVVDAGGGTVDVTVHQILPNGKIRELHAATGGAWGGTKVDESFINLLITVLGNKFVDKFQEEYPQQWLSLMTSFEKMKKAIKPDGECSLNIPLSWGIGSKYKEITGEEIDKVINKASNLGVKFSQGTFIIKHPTVKGMFQPVVNKTVDHLESLLGNRVTHPCRYFFLVGGFSECKYLQQIVMDRFAGRVDVLIPSEAQMSVIRGAVRFGHQPEQINSRISRRTYGCDYADTFIKGKHNENKLRFLDGEPNCIDLMKVFLVKGEEVHIGTSKSLSFTPGHAEQTQMGFKFYCIERKPNEVQYIDEDDVKLLATVTVQMPDVRLGKRRAVELQVTFGGTEIQIHATDVSSGNSAKCTLDFLAS